MKRRFTNILLRDDFLVTSLLFVGIFILTFSVFDWPRKAGILPLAVGILALFLLAIRLVNIIRKESRKPIADLRGKWKVGISFLILGIAVALASVITLPPAMGIMGASLAMVYGERRWRAILLIGIASFLVMYLLYGVVFNLPMRF